MGRFPLRIALLYAGVSVLWIIGSDRLVDLLFPHAVSTVQTFKGWAFVGVTTVLLFVLLRAELARRTKVETQLRESETRFRAIAETSPVALLLFRLRDGVVLFANSAASQLCQRDTPDLEGLAISDLKFIPNDPEDFRYAIIRRQGIQLLEGILILPDGKRRMVLGSFQKIRLGGKTVVATAAVDMTERRHTAETLRTLQSQLAHASRVSAMGEMAAQFAHELNQPLTIISSYATGALNLPAVRGNHADDVADVFRRIAEQAERAGEIIRRTRKFVERHEQEKTAIDVNALIRETVYLIQGEAIRRSVEMHLHLDDSLPPIFGDAVQIQQVVVNLARNGIEAMAASPVDPKQLVIRTERAQGGIVVSVEDSGVGIPPEIQARLFEPFFSTKADGLGIGLSICRSIVEAHGAELKVSSAPGRGSRFHFSLPVGGP